MTDGRDGRGDGHGRDGRHGRDAEDTEDALGVREDGGWCARAYAEDTEDDRPLGDMAEGQRTRCVLDDGTVVTAVTGAVAFFNGGRIRAYAVTPWQVGPMHIDLNRDAVADVIGEEDGIRLVPRVIDAMRVWAFVGGEGRLPCLIGDEPIGGGALVCGMDAKGRLRDLTDAEVGVLATAVVWVEADMGRGVEGWFALPTFTPDDVRGLLRFDAYRPMEVVDDDE